MVEAILALVYELSKRPTAWSACLAKPAFMEPLRELITIGNMRMIFDGPPRIDLDLEDNIRALVRHSGEGITVGGEERS